MSNPLLPMGASDNDPYFDDDSEPLLVDDDIKDDSRTDAELHGIPWPSSPTEAAGFEYEAAHWR